MSVGDGLLELPGVNWIFENPSDRLFAKVNFSKLDDLLTSSLDEKLYPTLTLPCYTSP